MGRDCADCIRHRFRVCWLDAIVHFPEALKWHAGHLESLFTFSYYSTNEKLNIPIMKESELDITIELATQLDYTTLKEQDLGVSRLKGELVMEQGRYRLLLGNEQV